ALVTRPVRFPRRTPAVAQSFHRPCRPRHRASWPHVRAPLAGRSADRFLGWTLARTSRLNAPEPEQSLLLGSDAQCNVRAWLHRGFLTQPLWQTATTDANQDAAASCAST